MGIRSRQSLLVWTASVLTLAGLGGGVAWRVLGPTAHSKAEAIETVRRALDRNDPVAARPHVDHCLARWPNDERVLFLAVQVARRSDAYADAERFLALYEKAIGSTEASRLEWVLLGVQQGDFGDAERRLLEAVTRRDQDSLSILEALAKGYRAARRPEAVPVLKRLLDLDPDHVSALLLRGDMLDTARQTEAAEKDFRRAVDIAPANAAAQSALAGLLSRAGRTREAIYHYELAHSLQPTDPGPLLGLARALADAAELTQAQQRLDELLANHPDHVDGLVERARLSLRQGQAKQAEPFLEQAVRAAPWHRDGQQLYMVVLSELGPKEAASQCTTRLAQLRDEDAAVGRLKLRARDTPGDQGIRWDLWQWSVRNGQSAEGLSWLLRILMTDPRNSRAHLALADYLDRAGQSRRAAQHRAEAGNPTRG